MRIFPVIQDVSGREGRDDEDEDEDYKKIGEEREECVNKGGQQKEDEKSNKRKRKGLEGQGPRLSSSLAEAANEVDKFIQIEPSGAKTSKATLVDDLNRDIEFCPHISGDRLTRIRQCAKLSELMLFKNSPMVGFRSVLAMQLPKIGGKNYEFGLGEIFKLVCVTRKIEVNVKITYSEFMQGNYKMIFKWYAPVDIGYRKFRHSVTEVNDSKFDFEYYSNDKCIAVVNPTRTNDGISELLTSDLERIQCHLADCEAKDKETKDNFVRRNLQKTWNQVHNGGYFDQGRIKNLKCCFCNKAIADMASTKCLHKNYYGNCAKISHNTCLPINHDSSMMEWCPDTKKHI